MNGIDAPFATLPLKRLISSIASGVSVNAIDSPAEDGCRGVLKTSCVYSGTFDSSENKTVVAEELELVRCPVKADTLVVSRMNTPDLVGAAGLALGDEPNIYLPDRLWQVTFDRKVGHPRFVYWWTRSTLYRDQVKVACAGTSSSMQNLDQDSFRSFAVPRLRMPEQERIAHFLDEQTARIDALIAEKERLASAVEELTLSKLVSASLAGNPVDGTYWKAVAGALIPEGWSLQPLRALFVECTAKNDTEGDENYLSLVSKVGIIPYAEKGDLGNKKPDDLTKCKLVEIGDFVLNSMNFGIGAFGVSPEKGVCSPVYIVLRPRVQEAQLDFLRLLFSSEYFQKSVQSLGRGIMELRYAFGWDDIKNLKVPLPSANVAAGVCGELSAIQKTGKLLRSHVDAHIELLREYRSSLISAAVTGQLDVGAPSEAVRLAA